ncbi:MAG: tetratricopeptide repeat protein [Myxococcota bacterium]
MTHTETKLLAYLSGHPNREIPVQELYREVWGYSQKVRTRAAYNLISRLRKKIEDEPSAPVYLQTVFGVGFMLAMTSPSTSQNPHTLRSGLPPVRDRFIGRQRELVQLRHQLQTHRLLTLAGPGGVGKSRLAVALGRELLAEEAERWPGGVWFVPLSTVSSAPEISTAFASAIGMSDILVDETRLTRILNTFGPALFILDNAEQIREPMAAAVGRWLTACSDARFLITSRAPLKHPEERVFRLEGLRPSEACALFAERAARHIYGPQGDDVRELVEMLDRLPLAVEMAAARTGTHSPRTLIDQMSGCFDLLRYTDQTRPARHQTLQATIEWSWQLLSADEQCVLAQCSVFEGGFTPEAAHAVVELDEDVWIEPILAMLVEHSLLTREIVGNGTLRLSMLATVQAFARQRLGAAPGVVSRHGRYYAQFITPDDKPSGTYKKLRILQMELPNLVAASQRGIQRADTDVAVRCALTAVYVYSHNGPTVAGVTLLQQVQALDTLTDLQWVKVCIQEAMLLQRAGSSTLAITKIQRGLRIAQQNEYPHEECSLWLVLGGTYKIIGDLREARNAFSHALNIAHRYDYRHKITKVLGSLANLYKRQGKFSLARQCYQDGLRISEQLNDQQLCGLHHSNFGTLLGEQGYLEEAEDHLQRALGIAQRHGDRLAEGTRLGSLGMLYRIQGEEGLAIRCIEKALDIARRFGDRRKESGWLYTLGIVYIDQGQFARAYTILMDALRVAEDVEHLRGQAEISERLAAVCTELGRIDEGATYLQRSEQSYQSMGNLTGIASVYYRRASIAHRLGDRQQAHEHLATLRELVERIELTEDAELWRDIRKLEAALSHR